VDRNILTIRIRHRTLRSRLSRARGSKQGEGRVVAQGDRRAFHGRVDRNDALFEETENPKWVAPFTGAWIETPSPPAARKTFRVAPFTGAWIETIEIIMPNTTNLGRAFHGRVDRNLVIRARAAMGRRRAFHGRVDRNEAALFEIGRRRESRLSRARGSKPAYRHRRPPRQKVAPFTGAWIETGQGVFMRASAWSRLSRARGSKLDIHSCRWPIGEVAPFTGAWIETAQRYGAAASSIVAPFTGAWIETLVSRDRAVYGAGRAFHGRVDRNLVSPPPRLLRRQSRLSRARGSKHR